MHARAVHPPPPSIGGRGSGRTLTLAVLVRSPCASLPPPAWVSSQPHNHSCKIMPGRGHVSAPRRAMTVRGLGAATAHGAGQSLSRRQWRSCHHPSCQPPLLPVSRDNRSAARKLGHQRVERYCASFADDDNLPGLDWVDLGGPLVDRDLPPVLKEERKRPSVQPHWCQWVAHQSTRQAAPPRPTMIMTSFLVAASPTYNERSLGLEHQPTVLSPRVSHTRHQLRTDAATPEPTSSRYALVCGRHSGRMAVTHRSDARR